jgi:NAD(P)-dependent dehydrogenase (short-subunit alcohol dehydrogenase family)
MNQNQQNLFSLEDQIVFLTGAAGQLGAEIANGLLLMGAKVIAVDKNILDLEEISNKHSWDSDYVICLECDVTNKTNIEDCFRIAINKFGVINSLIANAGVSVFEPFMEREESSIDYVMDVNLKGTIFCIQEFIKKLSTSQKNSIVSIASHYGLVSPDPRIYKDGDRRNSEIYGATKAGIIQMTKYFAVHASEYNVRVNAVSPGGIRNPDNPQSEDFQEKYNYRSPMGRMAETEEIIGAVLFLLSPAASYINGHNIVVDGGFSAW